MQIALLNNPGLQASYAEVGIAEADLVQASRWQGPRFSFARLRRGDEIEIERGVFFDVLGLLTIPLSTRASESRLRGDAEPGRRGGAARRARYAQGMVPGRRRAGDGAKYMAQVKESAEASAELARRMAAVGNFPKLDQAREQAFYAETTAQLARARHNATGGARTARRG